MVGRSRPSLLLGKGNLPRVAFSFCKTHLVPGNNSNSKDNSDENDHVYCVPRGSVPSPTDASAATSVAQVGKLRLREAWRPGFHTERARSFRTGAGTWASVHGGGCLTVALPSRDMLGTPSLDSGPQTLAHGGGGVRPAA